MRVIIAGSRDFNDYTFLDASLNRIFKQLSDEGLCSPNTNNTENIEIISGTARGADRLGERFAEEYKIKVKRFPADWDTYGKSAGYRRNADMAKYASEDYGVLVAFWDGQSKGTKHMIDLANKSKLRVFVEKY